MTQISREDISERSEEYQRMYKKKFLAMQLREYLNRDEEVTSLTSDVLAEMLAVFDEADISVAGAETHCECGSFLDGEGQCPRCD